jgi:CMP-N,N'-diacetyllegionaminic acid synthase|tara:strand:- start:1436 stop:2146 length:711 start_codon:yes stop_codon:yes gene_type:complete
MKSEKKIIAIICARSGSKGLKNKNLKLFNKKPLIYYPINAALKSGVIDDVLVTTDSEKIAKVAKKYGAEVPFLRSKKLSGDFATTENTLKDALLRYERLKRKKYDICVFLTATDIFRKIEWIKDCVKILKTNKNFDSVFSGHKTHKNFWIYEKNKWMRVKPFMKFYASRQIKKSVVREDTGLACASRAFLWREGKRIGDKVKILLNNDSFTSLDIHNLEDFKLAEYAYKLRYQNKS